LNSKQIAFGKLILLPPTVALMVVGGLVFGKEKKAKPVITPSSGGTQQPLATFDTAKYVIGPGDVLDINVWKEPDFSRSVPVRPDGNISVPLINDIEAAGRTPTQLAVSIAAMLRKYITQPQVTVIVTAINSRWVYVLGEVNRPGQVPLLPNMTVLQALSSAGGFAQFANEKGIYVLRNEDGRQITYPFNYKKVIRGKSGERNINLRPGDTIVVP
jgi:polysaccharide export outer membrane protein